jgi:hypothetical protein
MPNVKVQGSNEIQRPNDSKNLKILLFDIHLTLIHLWFIISCEICHLKLIFSSLFYMPETGIVYQETGITVGAHLG